MTPLTQTAPHTAHQARQSAPPHDARRRRWAPFIAAVVASASVLSACSHFGSTPTAAGARPVVLVHGAWMGASAWDRVATDLRARGISVTAVELPGHGQDRTPPSALTLASYVKAVEAALPAQGQATVVGHSMAGMVISALAESMPDRVANLVYVAAYLPQSGNSLYQLSQQHPDSRVGKYWTQADPKAYSPAWIRPEGIAEVFCADCSAADQQWLVDHHKPEAVPPLATPVTLSGARFGNVPRVYVHTRNDMAVSMALQRAMLAAAGGAQVVETLDTGHSPMLTQPKALAQIIARAASPQR